MGKSEQDIFVTSINKNGTEKKTNGLQMHFRVRTINIKRLQQLISHPLNSFDFCFRSLKPTLQVLKTFHFNSSPIRLLTLDQETLQSLLRF